MYNWTNDIPSGSRKIFYDNIKYFNDKGIVNPKIFEMVGAV